MRFMRRFRALVVSLAGLGLILSLAACANETTATTSALCAVVTGNGLEGNDRQIKKTVLPDQNFDHDEYNHEVGFFPCGPRNYIINDGTVLNANGDKVGDRPSPTVVWTKAEPNADPAKAKPRIKLNIWTSAFWTPNQGQLEAFYRLCAKYAECISKTPASGDANFSTKGWNGMLGENFGSTVDKVALLNMVGRGHDKKVTGFTSDIVSDPEQWIALQNAMSSDFMAEIRPKTGETADLFCASGTGGWPDKAKPGVGEFECHPVRIQIDRIEPADPDVRKQMESEGALQQEQLNLQKRIQIAKDLYGEHWAYFLGIQDSIKACQASDKPLCTIVVGGASGSIPTPARQ
jgi:hypothetical protein